MIYYKKKFGKKLYPIEVKTKEKAAKALKAVGIDAKKLVLLTEQEAKKFREDNRKPPNQELYDSLPLQSKNILETILYMYDEESISKEIIDGFGLTSDVDKPYYISYQYAEMCYGQYADHNDVVQFISERIHGDYSARYNFQIYNSKTLEPINVDIQIRIGGKFGGWNRCTSLITTKK